MVFVGWVHSEAYSMKKKKKTATRRRRGGNAGSDEGSRDTARKRGPTMHIAIENAESADGAKGPNLAYTCP